MGFSAAECGVVFNAKTKSIRVGPWDSVKRLTNEYPTSLPFRDPTQPDPAEAPRAVVRMLSLFIMIVHVEGIPFDDAMSEFLAVEEFMSAAAWTFAGSALSEEWRDRGFRLVHDPAE